MLSSTFIHLPGVGETIEEEIWRSGINCWSEFVSSPGLPARVQVRRDELCDLLQECQERLAGGDAAYFDRLLPPSEKWRLYADFRDRAAFLDIETTGLSPYSSDVTMVGVLDRAGFRAFVSGENLRDLPSALTEYDLFLTFNGAAFDLPFLEHFFGRPMFGHRPHIDLMYPLRRLGYRGGLKVVERRLGLDRGELSGLAGVDAVRLWYMWEDGDRGARDTLVRYNAEDVASLPVIAEFVFEAMVDLLPVSIPPLSPWTRARVDHLGLDRSALTRLRSTWNL